MSFDCLSHQGKDIMINIKESGAHAGTVFTPRPYDPKEMSVEEAAMGTIRLEGNFLVNFKFTWALNYPTSRSFVICGPEGGIDAENMKLYKNVGHYQAETDLKYFDSRLGEKYSGVPKYFEYASEAIRTMFAMTGPARLGDDGLLKRGMIIRHLVLPWQWRDSCRCLDWIHDTFGDDVFVSVMNQYMPIYKACLHPEINRPLTTLEYQKVIRHADEIGITKGFMQVGKTAEAKFIPNFNGDHVLADALHS
jgi:hypothetical protein